MKTNKNKGKISQWRRLTLKVWNTGENGDIDTSDLQFFTSLIFKCPDRDLNGWHIPVEENAQVCNTRLS